MVEHRCARQTRVSLRIIEEHRGFTQLDVFYDQNRNRTQNFSQPYFDIIYNSLYNSTTSHKPFQHHGASVGVCLAGSLASPDVTMWECNIQVHEDRCVALRPPSDTPVLVCLCGSGKESDLRTDVTDPLG